MAQARVFGLINVRRHLASQGVTSQLVSK
jgi:hypothetical protein